MTDLYVRAVEYPHWTCKTHGNFDASQQVSCPYCVTEMRQQLHVQDEILREMAYFLTDNEKRATELLARYEALIGKQCPHTSRNRAADGSIICVTCGETIEQIKE